MGINIKMKSIKISLIMACVATQAAAIKLEAKDIPAPFDTAALGDPFMETVIKDYSVQEKGHYYVPYDKAQKLATQVLTLDAGMTGHEAADAMGNFDKFWAHFDVLSEGKIAASQIIPFYQKLAHDSTLQCALKPKKLKFCEEYGTC